MQFCIYFLISLYVVFNFRIPKITITFMVIFPNVPISTMPKLSVAEYCDFSTFNDKIGFTYH